MDHVQSYRGKNSFGGSVGFSKPEWVICGGRLSVETVRVLASKELTHAELEALFTYVDAPSDSILPGATTILTSKHVTLHASMRKFIIIDGPDYAACLKYLFEQWSPDQEKNPLAIESPTGRLEYPSRPQIGH